MYGLTECKRCSYVPPHKLHEKSDSIGIPMPNLSMWIQDAVGNRVGANIEGELVVSGPSVMMGYWRDEVGTAKKIRFDSLGNKILLSGDQAVMDNDGYFYFKGRKDNFVKFNGSKLDCHEHVKKVIRIKGVNRAHLFLSVVDDLNQLIVCIELDSVSLEEDRIKKEIQSVFSLLQKPRYFYLMDQFPVLSNGKLDKRSLEKLACHHFCLNRVR
jgi:acyl-coenzyme A synthetase/AMP-(fatty) acid ligase